MFMFRNNLFSTACFIEALYEKKQTIMTYDNETAKLQAQVEELASISAEKDTRIAKFEAMMKGREGEMINNILYSK